MSDPREPAPPSELLAALEVEGPSASGEVPIGSRRIVAGIAAMLIVAATVVMSIGVLVGFRRLADAIRGADLRWLGICAIAQLIVLAGYTGAFRSAVSADDGPRVPVSVAVRVVLATFALTQIVAAGGAAGLAAMYWALRRLGMHRRDAAVRLIGLNTAVFAVFGLLGTAAAIVGVAQHSMPLGMAVPWLVAVPLAVLAARWFTDRQRVQRWTRPDGRLLRRALRISVSAAAWVRRQLTEATGRRLFWWAACYWAGDVISLWAALHAFDARPALAALVLAYTTGYVAHIAPIPFIATGGMDAATTFALHATGVPLELALAGVVAHRVFAFWLPLGPAVASAATLSSVGRSLESLGHPGPSSQTTPSSEAQPTPRFGEAVQNDRAQLPPRRPSRRRNERQ